MSALDTYTSVPEVQRLERRIAELESQLSRTNSPRIQILKEPLTYEARLVRDPSAPRGFRAISTREQRSYVQDFALAETKGDLEARARLQQHAREMRILGEKREQSFHPDASYEMEQRAPNWSSGTGGYFAPPLWIVEQFAYQPTPERVISRLAPCFELPVGAQSVNLPAWQAGADVGDVYLNAPSVDTAPVDTAISSAVATLAGTFDVPMQMLEQSPQGAHLDWVAFTTMEARYAYQLELQLITGTGAAVPQGSGNNQLLGIYNNTAIPAANNVAYTGVGEAAPGTTGSAAAGATSMFSFIGLAAAKVGQARLLPPEGWMITTSRAAWLGSSEDSQSRPLMLADNTHKTGEWDLLGYTVYLNDAIPRNSGPSGSEDRIIILRHSDWLILESEPKTNVSPFKHDNTGLDRDVDRGAAMAQVLGGSLMVRLQMRRYVAALLRYPSSVAYLSGSGMQTSGGW